MVQADHCANYNAFGRDPDGRLAYLASLFWGPEYVPPFPCQVFIGIPEPPRYGPPAAYQRQCLPAGWVPNPPPGPTPQPPYLEPPPHFDPQLFHGLLFNTAYINNNGSEDEDDDQDVDTDVDEDIHEGALKGVTDGESKDCEEHDRAGSDGSEGGEKMLSDCSDEEIEHSSDEAALDADADWE